MEESGVASLTSARHEALKFALNAITHNKTPSRCTLSLHSCAVYRTHLYRFLRQRTSWTKKTVATSDPPHAGHRLHSQPRSMNGVVFLPQECVTGSVWAGSLVLTLTEWDKLPFTFVGSEDKRHKVLIHKRCWALTQNCWASPGLYTCSGVAFTIRAAWV